MKIAIFPGSFDPVTIGHTNIVERCLPLFDKIIIGIGLNAEKKTLFSIDQRIHFLEMCFPENPKIEIQAYNGLTGEFCINNHAQFILRGVRNAIDYQYENDIAHTNKVLFNLETILIPTDPSFAFVSSSIVRDLYRHHGNYQQYLPEAVVIP